MSNKAATRTKSSSATKNGSSTSKRKAANGTAKSGKASNDSKQASVKALDLNVGDLELKTLSELRTIAKGYQVASFSRLKKGDLIIQILKSHAEEKDISFGGGVLEIMTEGIGFLRSDHLLPGLDDIYVSQSQIRRFGLRTGDMVVGQVREPKDTERYKSLLRVEAINGLDPDAGKRRSHFERLTPIYPDSQIMLETEGKIMSTRVLDMLAPIGRGQRALIVSPPKAGKTTIMKEVANGISANYRDVHLMVVLIGERPEEVTDMDRSVDAEVLAATFDEQETAQTHVAEMALERAKRLVEGGRDVVILMDSLTRLTRAYNMVVPASGRTLSGGIDPAALYPPKRFFGAARNLEEGGSLTVIATCLVDTGSRMDDVIYEEFKGTGNMELHLSRKLQERRIFPAIDVERSGTRREELLLEKGALNRVWTLRRMVNAVGGGPEAAELILSRLSKTESNAEFLSSLHKEIL
ncbi:MAG: transcription termination factor Rho [Chloroflexota bacterium]